MVSPEAPYPLDGGGALRTASLLHYFGERYQLDLVAFQHRGQEIARFLPPGLVRDLHLIHLREHRNDLVTRALRNASRVVRGRPPLVDRFSGYGDQLEKFVGSRRYDVAVIEHFWCASYLPYLRRIANTVVLDLHNIESAWHSSCAAASSPSRAAIHHLFSSAARRLEKNWMGHCDLILTTSQQDAQRVRELAPGLPVCVYPNAIPYREPLSGVPQSGIVFSGNMEYEPNLTAVQWMLQHVWPVLRERFPDLQLRLVGKNGHVVAPYTIGQANVTVTGAVEDTFPYLSSAAICIAPLRSGSGTRLKIIEAWAASRAVVSTSIGAEGLGAQDGVNLLIADSPENFVAAISRLLRDHNYRQKLAKSGRDLFETTFTWKVAWNTLSGCLSRCKR